MHVWNLCVWRVVWTSGIINKMLFHVWIVPFSQKSCGAYTTTAMSDQWNPTVNDKNTTQSQERESFSHKHQEILGSNQPWYLGSSLQLRILGCDCRCWEFRCLSDFVAVVFNVQQEVKLSLDIWHLFETTQSTVTVLTALLWGCLVLGSIFWSHDARWWTWEILFGHFHLTKKNLWYCLPFHSWFEAQSQHKCSVECSDVFSRYLGMYLGMIQIKFVLPGDRRPQWSDLSKYTTMA